MKKKLLAAGLSLVLATPSMAATAFIPQSILKNHHPSKKSVKNTTLSRDEYADFSGHWIGSCNQDPDEKVELNITLASDFSSINIDNMNYPIDAISTQSFHKSDEQENYTSHLRWSSDGQELLMTVISYYKEGNLSQDGLESMVGKAQLFMNQGQLMSHYELTYFTDGVLGNTLKIDCVYNNQNKE